MSPTTARRPRRAVPPLLVLAAITALAAPAYAGPPSSGGDSDSDTGGKVVAASHSGNDPRPDPRDIVIGSPTKPPDGPKAVVVNPPSDLQTVVVSDPGSGPGDGKGPKDPIIDPPPPSGDGNGSGTGQTVAAEQNLSGMDPWRDPPDVVISNPDSTK